MCNSRLATQLPASSNRIKLTEEGYDAILNTLPNVFVYFGGSMTVHTFFDERDTAKGQLERVYHKSTGEIEYFHNTQEKVPCQRNRASSCTTTTTL